MHYERAKDWLIVAWTAGFWASKAWAPHTAGPQSLLLALLYVALFGWSIAAIGMTLWNGWRALRQREWR